MLGTACLQHCTCGGTDMDSMCKTFIRIYIYIYIYIYIFVFFCVYIDIKIHIHLHIPVDTSFIVDLLVYLCMDSIEIFCMWPCSIRT